MLKELLFPEILELIENKNWRVLKDTLADWPYPDVASLIQSLDESNMAIIFRLLHASQAADVFSELEPDTHLQLISEMSNDHLREIITELSPDDRTELFEELPGKVTQKLMNIISPDIRRDALKLLGYPENSVGRLMTPEYVAIKSGWTIEQALAHIRKYGHDAETINMVYVIDDQSHLIDDIPLRRLILTDPSHKVETIMDEQCISTNVHSDQEEAIRIIEHYNLTTLPVMDNSGVLVGIVTVDDIIDALQEEVTEDIHKGASVVPLEMNYSITSMWNLYRKRVGWLSLLAVAGFLSSSVIAVFEKTLASIVALAFFIPVLIDSGGNTGSQSATLIIRALATGDLTPKKWFEVIRKELFIGILLGITLGTLLYIWGFFWKGGPEVGLVVGISMTIIIFTANLVGSLLPIVLTKLKLDPAIVSSPLITTIIDAAGLFIYFSIARMLIKI